MRDDSPPPGTHDEDLPEGIRYDPDLAVHEPATVPGVAVPPSRRRSPVLLFGFAAAVLVLLVYVLFGLIASEGKTSADYVNEIRAGHGAWQAAWELSRLLPVEAPERRDPRLVDDLVSLFEDAGDDDPRVRRSLALALGEARDPRAVEALAAAVGGDDDGQTRLYAAWGLGAIGDPRGAGALMAQLDDEDAALRKVAVYALGSLLPAAGTTEALHGMLHDPVEDVAWNAALALARHGDASGSAILGRMLDRRYLDGVRRQDESGTQQPLPEARKEEIIVGALQGLARLRDASHLAAVRALSESDPNLRVRQAAIETLAVLDGST